MRFLLLLLPLTLFANLNIAVSYPYIGSLAKSIGGEHINTIVLAQGDWDPHFIVPRPSLIAKLRSADGLIANGGELEIGWLPPLLERAANKNIQIGSKGYMSLFDFISPIEIPKVVDRSCGDVHAQGNPHFHLNPHNILRLGEVVKMYLVYLDPANKNDYEKNHENFTKMWNAKLSEWDAKMQMKKGFKVVQYHNLFAYFLDAYEVQSIATIEPLPGIPPSSKHAIELIDTIEKEKPVAILHDVYHSTKTAQFLSSKTGIKVIMMPHDIQALDSIKDLVSLFDYLTDAF